MSQTVCFQPSGYVIDTGDCDDTNTAIYNGAPEVCDTLDNNCDTLVDDADPLVIGQGTFYTDGDGDGSGAGSAMLNCFQPNGTSIIDGDCVDTDPAINPSAIEVCDTIDNDCDGDIDDLDNGIVGQTVYYEDADLDGYGSSVSQTVCYQPSGYVTTGGDCNDADAGVKPSAAEVCDNIDNDCDGATDDADSGVVGQTTFYQDDDGDGFGTSATQTVCFQPSNYAIIPGDCVDSNYDINPNANEVCDGLDNNCDGLSDDSDPGIVGQPTYYEDDDGDGYGTSVSITTCSPPSGHSANTGDCNDGDGGINPGAAEVCVNGTDENCNGSYSEGCGVNSLNCGGPGALQPGVTVGCGFGTRVVTAIRVRGGCNDGESGNYTVSFSDGTSVNFNATCGTTVNVGEKITSSATLYMNSGGGGDGNISWRCCGSTGHDVYYK